MKFFRNYKRDLKKPHLKINKSSFEQIDSRALKKHSMCSCCCWQTLENAWKRLKTFKIIRNYFENSNTFPIKNKIIRQKELISIEQRVLNHAKSFWTWYKTAQMNVLDHVSSQRARAICLFDDEINLFPIDLQFALKNKPRNNGLN